MRVSCGILAAALAAFLPAQQATNPDGTVAGTSLPIPAPLAQGIPAPLPGPDGVVSGGGSSGLLTPLAVDAGFSTFGSGCTGTGSRAGGPYYVCTSGNGGETTNLTTTMGGNATFVLWARAIFPLSIGGFQMLVSRGMAGTTTAHLFLDDGTGSPAATPVRTGIMSFGPDSHWATVTFARPYVVTTGQLYFLGFDNPASSIHPISSGTVDLTHYWRTSPSAPWTGPFTNLAWTLRVLCSENPCLSANAEITSSTGNLATNAWFLMRVQAETGTAVSGFQLPIKGPADGSTQTRLYGADASGRPSASPLRTGVMRYTTETSWQPTTFEAPAFFAPGSYFFIGFHNPSAGLQCQPTVGTTQTHFWMSSTATSWSGPWNSTRWAFKVDKNQTYVAANNGSATVNSSTNPASNATFAYVETAATNLQVAGFELLLTASAEGAMPAYLYLADAAGAPTGSPVGETTISFGVGTAWTRATFHTPRLIGSGSKYCIAYRTPSTVSIRPVTTSGSMGTHYWMSASSTSWGGPFTSQRWAYRVFCPSAADPSSPAMGHRGYPVLGQRYAVDLNFARPSTAAIHFIGVSRNSFSGLPLPFPLGHLGAVGCALRVSPDLGFAVPVSSSGFGTLNLSVPNNPVLEGARIYHQWAVLDGPANPMGLVLSDGGESLVGR